MFKNVKKQISDMILITVNLGAVFIWYDFDHSQSGSCFHLVSFLVTVKCLKHLFSLVLQKLQGCNLSDSPKGQTSATCFPLSINS